MKRNKKTEIPVGATWEGKGSGNRTATIYLASRDVANGRTYEMWRWSASYSDSSFERGWADWGTSYQSCKSQIPFSCRMKRVK